MHYGGKVRRGDVFGCYCTVTGLCACKPSDCRCSLDFGDCYHGGADDEPNTNSAGGNIADEVLLEPIAADNEEEMLSNDEETPPEPKSCCSSKPDIVIPPKMANANVPAPRNDGSNTSFAQRSNTTRSDEIRYGKDAIDDIDDTRGSSQGIQLQIDSQPTVSRTANMVDSNRPFDPGIPTSIVPRTPSGTTSQTLPRYTAKQQSMSSGSSNWGIDENPLATLRRQMEEQEGAGVDATVSIRYIDEVTAPAALTSNHFVAENGGFRHGRTNLRPGAARNTTSTGKGDVDVTNTEGHFIPPENSAATLVDPATISSIVPPTPEATTISKSFRTATIAAYNKLVACSKSPGATVEFQNFANSWSGVDEIVGIGRQVKEKVEQYKHPPEGLREAYCLLHFTYGLSQTEMVKIPTIGEKKIYEALRSLKSGILVVEQDLFDEIAAAMAMEFGCALSWMRKNKLDYFLERQSTRYKEPLSVADWLRLAAEKTRWKEELSLNDYGKDPPPFVELQDLDACRLVVRPTKTEVCGDLAISLLCKGFEVFTRELERLSITFIEFCRLSFPSIPETSKPRATRLYLKRVRKRPPDKEPASRCSKRRCEEDSNPLSRGISDIPDPIHFLSSNLPKLLPKPCINASPYNSTDAGSPDSSSGRTLRLRPRDGGFQCTIPGCDRRYSGAEYLKRHMSNYHSSKSSPPGKIHKCPYCPAARGGPRGDENLQTHIREKHPEKVGKVS
ncbi:hypothetical protein ABW19_dt0205045 [Dactylella cylindrospora]|nr:hypothetical protein ABW19_dt0205045 [Dactylella cylindrospora]